MTRDTYIKDDWDDNALTGRTSPETGAFLHPAGDTEAGDCLVGMYRPEWDTEEGTPGASGGALVLDGSETVKTGNQFTTGSSAVDVTAQSSPDGGHRVIFLAKDFPNAYTDNGYLINARYTGDYLLQLRDGGTTTSLISASWPADTVTYRYESTRDSYGGLELLLDSTSKGTSTDTTHASSRYFGLENGNTVTVNYDNLTVK